MNRMAMCIALSAGFSVASVMFLMCALNVLMSLEHFAVKFVLSVLYTMKYTSTSGKRDMYLKHCECGRQNADMYQYRALVGEHTMQP